MEYENRMVSAEWLKNKYYEICDECNSSVIFIDRIIDEIDDAPDVDVVEVKHGRWVRKQIGKYTGVDEVCCSICGNFEGVVTSDAGFSAAIEGMNYCPNCGADMR